MPLSTSSSRTDIPYRDIPDQPWPHLLAAGLGMALLALAGWEGLARGMERIPGSYYELHSYGPMWAEERRKLDRADSEVDIVLAGSSRMLWNADLDIMEQAFGTRPIQLAIAGTGPALFVQDIVKNTDFDGLMLVGVTPFLFNRMDEGFFGHHAVEWYHEGVSPSKYTGWRLYNMLGTYLAFLDESFALFDLVNRYATPALPGRAGAENLMGREWKLGNTFADRQTDMWPPIEREGSFDNQQILNFWMAGMGRPPETPEQLKEMADEATAFFKPLLETLRARGGDMIFIRMPSRGRYLEHDRKTDYDTLFFDIFIQRTGAAGLNTMDYPPLSSELDIPEWSHMSRASQDIFSRRLPDYLETVYRDRTGRSIHNILDTAPPQERDGS